ncbi:MAG: nuclear transport factor 2 family protein [Cyclobacteriaceae bacterium]
MKFQKKIILPTVLITFILSACNTSTDQYGNVNLSEEETKVKEVITAYKSGIESLSVEGLSDLFMKKSEVFESGSDEGSFSHYLDHHLAPELEAFESFDFNDHKMKVKIDMPYAFTTETYTFKIVVKSDEPEGGQVIERKGVATSVLKFENDQWKIMKTHSSSRGMSSSH